MSAAIGTIGKSNASLKVSQLSGDVEMNCLNLQIMLDSIIDSLDGLSDDLLELGGSMLAVHARFNAINCFTVCSKRMVQDVLECTLAMTKASHEAQQ